MPLDGPDRFGPNRNVFFVRAKSASAGSMSLSGSCSKSVGPTTLLLKETAPSRWNAKSPSQVWPGEGLHLKRDKGPATQRGPERGLQRQCEQAVHALLRAASKKEAPRRALGLGTGGWPVGSGSSQPMSKLKLGKGSESG